MRISQTIKSLVHGVSTHDILLRNPAFLEEQHNMLTSSASGLHKRPPTVVVDEAFTTAIVSADYHLLRVKFRIKNKNFWLIVEIKTDGTVVYDWDIYDINGINYPVTLNKPATAAYLVGALTSSDLSVAVRDDTLIITNKTRIVEMAPATRAEDFITVYGTIGRIVVLSAPVENQNLTISWLVPGAAARTATVLALGTTLTLRGTDWIAAMIAAEINLQTVANDVRAVAAGSCVVLYSLLGLEDLGVVVEDNANGTTAIGINETVASVTELPRFGLLNDILKIKPSQDHEHSIYMMAVRDGQAMPAAIDMYPVRWDEVSHPDETYQLLVSTMPQIVAYDGVNFRVDTNPWTARSAGDEDSNPLPSFIGSTITAMDIFQSRLVAISGETLETTETIPSSATQFSWFRSTVSQVLSTHNVSVNSTSEDSSDIVHIVKHNKDMLLFTDSVQLKLDGAVPLTPTTAGLPIVTKYNSDTSVRPLSMAKQVFFAAKSGKHTDISQYVAGSTANTQDQADSITEYIKTYMPADPIQILGSSDLGILLVVFSDAIYICDLDTSSQEDLRFAWSKWAGFSDSSDYDIKSVILENNELYILHGQPAAIGAKDMITKLTIQTDPSQESLVYSLDLQKEATIALGASTLTLTDDVWFNFTENIRVIEKATGAQLPHTHTAGLITLDNPVDANTTVVYGLEYECYMIPSAPLIRDASGIVNRYANLGITSWTVDLVNSAEVYADIVTPHYNYDSQLWSGLLTFNIDSQVGVAASNSSAFNIGFNQPADQANLKLWSKGHLPMNIVVLDYLGKYNQRGKRF